MICEKCGKEHDGTFGSGRFCSRACANSRVLNDNVKHKISIKLRKNTTVQYCLSCKQKISKGSKTGYCKNCFRQSKEYRQTLSNSLSGKVGGYRIGSGRGKRGTYKGYYCDSSWELAYVIYNLEHNIKFERNRQTFNYVYNCKVHKYMPDWKIDDTYIEIKGYWSEQWQAKLNQFPKDKNLIIIDKETIKPYLEYAISKYGNDFTKLYSDSKNKLQEVDYSKVHWWTNILTGQHTCTVGKLEEPWKFGRI